MHVCVRIAAPNSALNASVAVAERTLSRTLVQLGDRTDDPIKIASKTLML